MLLSSFLVCLFVSDKKVQQQYYQLIPIQFLIQYMCCFDSAYFLRNWKEVGVFHLFG